MVVRVHGAPKEVVYSKVSGVLCGKVSGSSCNRIIGASGVLVAERRLVVFPFPGFHVKLFA